MGSDAVKKTCKVCGLSKDHVWTGKRIGRASGTAGSKLYVDKCGRLWNGRTCPECKRKAAQEYAVKHKAPTDRLCRMCSVKLDSSRYFNCKDCVDGTEEEYGADAWGYVSHYSRPGISKGAL